MKTFIGTFISNGVYILEPDETICPIFKKFGIGEQPQLINQLESVDICQPGGMKCLSLDKTTGSRTCPFFTKLEEHVALEISCNADEVSLQEVIDEVSKITS